jgi:hypothetical protein
MRRHLATFFARVPRWLMWGYLACAVTALCAVWAHRYPAGIDLPQHANLLQILANYDDPRTGYRFFYRLDFFTPYALTYLLGWPLARLFGALYAVKILLSAVVLATPLALMRWLRVSGSPPALALFGFLLAFAFPYHWGFLSMLIATPLCFLYLSLLEELKQSPSPKRVALAAASGVLVFFSHGISFGVTMLAGGIALLLQRSLRRIVYASLHYVPILAVLALWALRHGGRSESGMHEPATHERVVRVFTGLFSGHNDHTAMLGGVVVVAALFIFGRPAPSGAPGKFVPLTVALLGLLFLPETVFDTWLVGSRFAYYAHAFAPVAFHWRPLPGFKIAMTAVVVGALGVLNYRLHIFNEELAGIDALKAHMARGADVMLFPDRSRSEVFGHAQHGQAPAWITAARGGILENDSSQYFQLPVQKRSGVPWPSEWRYFVARGSRHEAAQSVGGRGQFLASAGDYHVFEAPRLELRVRGIRLVRYAQSGGRPTQDGAAGGRPLAVAGRPFAHGVGVRTPSVLQVRPLEGVSKLVGSVGLNEGTSTGARAMFRVMDARRKTLWRSPELTPASAPVPFEVSLKGVDGDVFLVTGCTAGNDAEVYADWLELAAIP